MGDASGFALRPSPSTVSPDTGPDPVSLGIEKEKEQNGHLDSIAHRPSRHTTKQRPSSTIAPKNDAGGDVQPSRTQTSDAASTSHSVTPGKRKRHRRSHKAVERMPFLREPSRDNNGPWVKRTKDQSSWFALFYDLALVAVLTVFSGTHELTHPAAIPIFLSYFAILSWTWTSQCFYDIRYEADDAFHRLIKSCQIIAFIFIGAASGNWNLNTMQSPNRALGTSLEDGARNLSCEESFTTITIAFAISRGLLLLQYIVAMLLGLRSGRRIHPLLISSIGLALGLTSLILAAALPFKTDQLVDTKIALVYLPLLFELAGGLFQMRKMWHHQVSTESIGERYGGLTLIILGEGFISLTRAFSQAISGLSQKSTSTYAQVFVAIMIIVFTFLFLFGRFNKEDRVHHSRIVIWEAVHFPLHFFLLLLLAAIVNFIVTLSFAHGLTSVTTQFLDVIESYDNRGVISSTDANELENYIAKLQLEPPFRVELAMVKQLNDTVPVVDDVAVVLDKYLGQIVLQTIRSYGIEIPDQVFTLFTQLEEVNATINYSAANVTESKLATRAQAADIVSNMVTIPTNEALSGIIWLFPCAGAVLLFAAIRSMVWYRFVGVAHWIIHAPMLFSSVALCLLGFVDLGSPTITIDRYGVHHGDAPIMVLIYDSLPLVIVMLVYMCTYYVSLVVMSCVQRRKGGVFANAEESRWIA